MLGRRGAPTQYTPAQLPAYIEGTPLHASVSRPSHSRFLGRCARCYRVPPPAPASTTANGEGEEGEVALRERIVDDSDVSDDDECGGGVGGGVYTAARFEAVVRRADVGAEAGEETLRGVRQWCAALLVGVLQAAAAAAQAGDDTTVTRGVKEGEGAADEQAASLQPLTDDERVEQGLAAKRRGAALFKDAQWRQAAAEYSAAATLLEATAAVQKGQHDAVQMEQAEHADGAQEAGEAVDVRREVRGGGGGVCLG